MKHLKIIYLLVIAMLFIQCSSDGDDGPKGYFPKKITIVNTLNILTNNREVNITYSNTNLISKIEFNYLSGTVSASNFDTIYFEYTSDNNISEIKSLNLNGIETITTFTHDSFGVITEINIFVEDESTIEISSGYNSQSNTYSLNGIFANFPLEFNFDNNDVIQSVSGPAIDNRIFNYSAEETQVFKNLRQQPELIMWAEILTFGGLNLDLYYLTPYKLDEIKSQSLDHRTFNNFETDANNNLIKFKSTVLFGAGEREYTVLYEQRFL
tara:strand:+ start:2334 stop:3137 length:804 start_codon:yes stop_codon:yes gene_type:complete